jgi:hypothetical protein
MHLPRTERKGLIGLQLKCAACLLLLACASHRASDASTAARTSAEPDPVCPAGYVRYTGFDAESAIGASAQAVFESVGSRQTFALSVQCPDGGSCSVPDRSVEVALRYAGAELCAGHDCSEAYPDLLFTTISEEQRASCPRALLTHGKLRVATDAGSVAQELDVRVVAHGTSDASVRGLARASENATYDARLGAGGRPVDLDVEIRLRAGVQQGVLDVTASRVDHATDVVTVERLARFDWPAPSD